MATHRPAARASRPGARRRSAEQPRAEPVTAPLHAGEREEETAANGLEVLQERLAVEPRTIRRMIARGDLHAVRLPGMRIVRIDRAEIDTIGTPIPTAGDVA